MPRMVLGPSAVLLVEVPAADQRNLKRLAASVP
jgi:hypothetical protein